MLGGGAVGAMGAMRTARERIGALCGLWALAVAQPVLDLIGRQPEFLVVHHLQGMQVVLLAGLGAVGVPLVAALVLEAVARFSPSLGRGLALFLAGLLLAVLAFQVGCRAGVAPQVALGLALMAGVVGAVAIARIGWVGRFAVYLAPATLVVPLSFLFVSPVRQLLAPERTVDFAATGSTSTPLVLVVLDELPLISLLDRNLEIDVQRFPSFARLARESTWFRDASTVGDSTTMAVPAMLSGVRPPAARLAPTSANFPRTLFGLLGRSHELRVLGHSFELCPRSLCGRGDAESFRWREFGSDLGIVSLHVLLPAPWRARLPPVDSTWRDFRAPAEEADRVATAKGERRPGKGSGEPRRAPRLDLPGLFARFLASFDDLRTDDGRPTAHVLHLMLPHSPWRFLPSGRRYFLPEREGFLPIAWEPDEHLASFGWQRHLLQAAYTDRLLGQLLDRLQSSGLWDGAVVAVVADHGASFRPGVERRALNTTNYREILGVPLFVKRPHQTQAEIVERNVELIDLFPTLAAATGVAVPWPIEGQDLFGANFVARPLKRCRTMVSETESREYSFPPRLLAAPEELQRRLEAFGSGPVERVLTYGPLPEMLGRAVATLPRPSPSSMHFTFSEPHRLDAIDPTAEFLPTLFVGRLQGDGARPGMRLALALNGVVAATGWSVDGPAGTRFRLLVPESSLERGRNKVALYALEEAPAGPAAWQEIANRSSRARPGRLRAGSRATAMPGSSSPSEGNP
jgi:hypothetical protein